MTRTLGVDINILYGNIEYIKDEALGKMVVSVSQGDKPLDQENLVFLRTALEAEGLHVEVLGYVA